jgi:DnaJ-domain-containing protein 1
MKPDIGLRSSQWLAGISNVFSGGEAEKVTLPVALVLNSGERLQGDLLLTRAQKLHEVLNRPEQFLEFAARDGRLLVISKNCITSASAIPDLPQTDQLSKRPGMTDPYKVLEVERTVSHQELRSAYHAKARLYHPDQFANHPLPTEVVEYLNAMFIHIQTAYDELSSRPEHGSSRAA